MIFLFNPSCEMAVRQDRDSYTPPRSIATMEDDLAALMTYVSCDTDAIVGHKPDDTLIRFWQPHFGHREYIDWNEAAKRATHGEKIAPWGLSKATITRFGLTDRARRWEWRDLLSRRTSVATECALATLTGEQTCAAPVATKSEQELRHEIGSRLVDGDGIVIKSLWSAAGRGVRFFNQSDTDAAIAYGMNCINADGCAIVENRLRRIAEFSYLFNISGDAVEYRGINRYHSTDGGAMGWELAGPQPNIPSLSNLKDEIEKKSEALSSVLHTVLATSGYEGPVGVDAMVYSTNNGDLRLRPCTEVNVRFCMGHVAQGILKAIAPEASVRWRTWHFRSNGEWDAFCATQSEAAPPVLDSCGRLISGFFRLTTAGRSVRFGACGWAGPKGVTAD